MEQKQKKARFAAGSLVMLSRKATEFTTGKVVYAYPKGTEPKDTWRHMPVPTEEKVAGELDRGVPILILEDPERVRFTVKVDRRSQKKIERVEKYWKIRFLLDEKIYHMYLTQKQYHNELVKAVSRRMKKDYKDGAVSLNSQH